MTKEIGEGLKRAFPVAAGRRTLELLDIHHDDLPEPDDWNGQKETVMHNRTWGTPLKATVALKDEKGKVIDKKTMRLALMPTPTNRHTFIVDGREYQVSHQRRLKPGIYTKVNRLGHPVADFNLGKGRNFSVTLDPAKNEFHMKFANTHIPLAPVAKHVFGQGLGLGDHFEKPYSEEEELDALKTLFAETHRDAPPANKTELVSKLKTYFSTTNMNPNINQMTVGQAHVAVTGDALQHAARDVLAIHKGEKHPTHKDQMAFQEVHGVEDFLRERIEKNKHLIASKLRQKLDRVDKLDDLNLHAAFQPMIHSFFTTSSLSNNPIQVNPLEMKENAFKITSMGEGGIGDSNAIPSEVRNIHPSTAGFIDPVRTPDNAKAGVDVRAAIGTTKVGKQLVTKVYDKKGSLVTRSPMELFNAVVAHDKEPVDHGVVRAIQKGHIVYVKPEQVEYRIPTENQFTVSTAVVPFIPNSHAHRVAMGAKMLGQAVSLVDREVPIVDTTHSDAAVHDLVPKAPVSGKVTKVDGGVVHIKGDDGKSHKVNFAHEFPLNGGSFLHTDLHVKVGDSVKKGQHLGDTNFTKGGKLALGKNLEVAYIPFKGLNYEDGLVVTHSGAQKLTSQHLHTEEVDIDERSIHDLSKYKAHFPSKYEMAKLGNLDEHGVVKVGTVLREGDPIIAMMRKRVQDPEQLILGKAHKALMEPFRDASIEWTRPYEGKVTAVTRTGGHIKVTIEAKAPAMVGDKICGRYGNKGVIAAIVPDDEAPRTKDGRIPDVMINSAGLVSRMNNGQIYEVAAGKALRALGKTSEKFPQFMDGVSTHDVVSTLVRKAGIEESEVLYDGKTGQPIGKHLMGPQYMLKLFKQAETGFAARSGGKYDIDLRPAKGGEEGAKSVGYLDLFGFLSHGANNLLRENASYKAEYNPEVFQAMWRGVPLPPPKPTFAFNKFEAMLRGTGVNVKKDGTKMTLLPMTDKDVLKLSSGKIEKPLTVNAKEDPHTGLPFRPEEGGLFDHTATGGLVGNRWSHITLHEPVVNPLFKKPARILLGMKKDEFEQAIATEGGAGIAKRLSDIDVDHKIASLKAQLGRTNAIAKRDEIYKQLKYLSALKRNEMKPHEAYVLNHIPVVPPNVRPMYPDAETGNIVQSDANKLYQNLMLVNEQLKHHAQKGDPATVNALRLALHDHVSKVQGLDGTVESQLGEKDPKGFLKVITGNRAKEGFFQSKLISRRQDIAGRGVIVPNPKLGIDEVGIPEPMAWTLYRNHTVGELVKSGMPLDSAAKEIEDKTDVAKKALMASMQNHPVIITRAPSLHKFNLQAFKPQLVAGKSIEINTLIHKGFNADHDGDQMNVHVPITPEGAKDAFKMLPSNNLFSPLNRSPIHVPTQEVIMGLWKITNIPAGSKPVKRFATKAEAMAAFKKGEISIHDPIEVGSV